VRHSVLWIRVRMLCGMSGSRLTRRSRGQGPNEGDCAVVSNELVNGPWSPHAPIQPVTHLLADNFDIPAGDDVAFIYGSCHATFSNRASVDMSYCGTDGAAITSRCLSCREPH
jgi:hypothetical protein